MKIGMILFLGCWAATSVAATPQPPRALKACVFQPPYALNVADVDATMQWEFDQLRRCDESLDLIVRPEASDRQARVKDRAEIDSLVKKYHEPLLSLCAQTAQRCQATGFVIALDRTPTGARNTTFAFNRTGTCVGKYDKEHLTAGEHRKWGFDASYMWEWSEPKILEIDGVR